MKEYQIVTTAGVYNVRDSRSYQEMIFAMTDPFLEVRQVSAAENTKTTIARAHIVAIIGDK